jgi:hypothetical protein
MADEHSISRLGRVREASVRRLEDLDLARAGLALIACLFVFAVLGSVRYVTRAAPLSPFDLDGELTVPAFFQGALLLAAGIAAWAAASTGWPRWRWTVVGFGLFLMYMGVDEVAVIHEHLGKWTGLGETVRELPIVLTGGILGALTLWQLRPFKWAAVVLVAGGSAWFAAQVLEKIELSGRLDSIYGTLMVAEETLEPLGSALLLAAFALVVRAYEARQRTAKPKLRRITGLPDGRTLGDRRQADPVHQRSAR